MKVTLPNKLQAVWRREFGGNPSHHSLEVKAFPTSAKAVAFPMQPSPGRQFGGDSSEVTEPTSAKAVASQPSLHRQFGGDSLEAMCGGAVWRHGLEAVAFPTQPSTHRQFGDDSLEATEPTPAEAVAFPTHLPHAGSLEATVWRRWLAFHSQRGLQRRQFGDNRQFRLGGHQRCAVWRGQTNHVQSGGEILASKKGYWPSQKKSSSLHPQARSRSFLQGVSVWLETPWAMAMSPGSRQGTINW